MKNKGKKNKDINFNSKNFVFTAGEVKEVLWRLEFKGDPIDRKYMLWECPEDRYMALYLCLGVAIGAAVGGITGNPGTSISIGMVLGMALGTAFDESHKKTRDTLYKKRVDAASKR